MDELNVTPGLLTVWRAVPRGVEQGTRQGVEGAAGWVADGRAASYVQEAHIAGALAGGRGTERDPAWLATAFELPGEARTEGGGGVLEAALLAWIDRHESLRSRLVPEETSRGGLRRDTLPVGGVSLRRTVEGNFACGKSLASRIEEVFDAETDPLAWPSFVFATVEHADGHTLYLGFDHSNVDGYSILLIAHEIHELYAAVASGTRAALTEVGSYLDFADIEREYAALVHTEHAAVVRWREFLGSGGGGLPEFPARGRGERGGLGDPGERSGSGGSGREQIGGCELLLDADAAHAFQRACRPHGGNFLTGVLTCLALAAREEEQGERELGWESGEFRALTPFHTRGDARWAHSVGWYVGLAPLRFPVRRGDSFADILTAASTALDGAGEMAAIPFPRVSELLGRRLEPRFVVSYMDMRRTPGARRWGEWKAAALRSRRVHPDEVYLWVNRSYDGVHLSFRHPATEPARHAVSRLVAGTGRLMRRLAAEGVPGTAVHVKNVLPRDLVPARQQEPAPC
ncbi:condensation domain-containing protein [Streptomyces sp. NPDC088124]|uniref:condensation domain-containing protein n=1 Tax=Streptomyces sp. NPDC088124 TaxID=3154654 RepID=UPI00341CE4C9